MESKKPFSERFFARLKKPFLPVLILLVATGCSNGGGGDKNPAQPSSSSPAVSSATSTSSAVSSSSSSIAPSPTTLSGQVKTFPDTDTGQSKAVVRKVYDPDLFGQAEAGSGGVFQAGEDGGDGNFSRDEMVPSRALVSIFLLSDVDYEEPIATVPTDENGNYTVTVDDVRAYLLGKGLITANDTDSTIMTAFRSLGQLQVRALIVRERNGVKRALAIQSIADPADVDENNEPNPVTVDPIVHRVVSQVVTQIRDAIQSLKSLGLTQSSVDQLSKSVIDTVVPEIKRVISESANSVITIPEGQTPEQVIVSQEDESALVVDSSQIQQMETVINAIERDETAIQQAQTLVSTADDLVGEEDSTLGGSLESEEQGLLAGLSAAFTDNVSNEVDAAIEAASESGNLETVLNIESGQSTADALAAAQAEKERILRKGLQSFFMSMGLVVVLEENQAGDAMVVAVRLPVPPHIATGSVPGGRGLGEREIRLFKLGSGSLDSSSKFTADSTATLGALDGNGVPQAPLYYAEPFDQVVTNLLGNQTMEAFQAEVDDAFGRIANPTAAPTQADFALIDKVNLYHELNRRLKSANIVSLNLQNTLISKRDASVQIKQLAGVIAENFTWARDIVNLTPEGFPVFTGRQEILTGGKETVDGTELVKALSLTLGASATEAAQKLTQKVGFYAQFAPDAVQTNIERARFTQGQAFDLIATLLNVYPATADGYRDLVLGTSLIPPTPAYENARDRVSRGLTSAVPSTLFGRTLTSESSVNIRSALFLLDYVLRSDFLVQTSAGYFKAFELTGANGVETRWVPNFSNYKFLKAGDSVTVSTLISSLLNITQVDNGVLFRELRPLILGGVGVLPVIPEFKEQDITEFQGDNGLATQADIMSMSCTVQRFDGVDPQSQDTSKNLELTLFPVEYSSTGQFYKGDPIAVTMTSSLVTGDGPTRRTYTLSDIPTKMGENFGRDYVVRLSIASYQNELPELFFWADGFVPNLDLCPSDSPLFIGPDNQFVAIPGLGLMVDQMRYDFNGQPQGLEGVDLSNFELPGAPIFVSTQEQTSGQGDMDFMLVSSANGYALQAAANSGVTFAPVFGGYEAGALSLSIDPAANLEPFHDLGAIVGAKVRSLIESALATPSLMAGSIAIDPANFDPHRVYLMKDVDGKFWVLELRYIDVFDDVAAGTSQAFMDFGFARINTLGEIVIPEPAFDSAPAPTPGDSGGLRYYSMVYGDWLVLHRPDAYQGPDLLEPEQVSFGGADASYQQLADATTGVFLRYAGEHFEENITGADDFDSVFGNPPDYSSIPVRIDAGREGITFVKLSFNKTDRKYVMSPMPENRAGAVTQLKHNNIVAVFDNMADKADSPVYLARVVRHLPADDPYANFELNLEVMDFAALQGDGQLNEKDVVCLDSDLGENETCPTGLPTLQVSVDGTMQSVGTVFDADFDGVPALFDPNDADPNIPGAAPSSGGGSGGPIGGGTVGGLHIGMMAESDGVDGVERSFLMETEGIYPGDIQSVAVKGALLGSSEQQVLFTCVPPKVDSNTGEFTDYQCTPRTLDGDVSVALHSKLGDHVAFKVSVPESILSALGNRTDVEFTVNFRAPTDLDGNPFKCGTENCPAQPSILGMRTVPIISSEVQVLTDMSVASGTDAPTSFAESTSLDVGRPLTLSGSVIPGAVHYELMVFCPGSLPGDTEFFPEENIGFYSPGRDASGRAIAPKFEFEISWLSGRTCEFTFNATLENSAGEFVGMSTWSDDIITTGGVTGGGFVNNEIRLQAGQSLCFTQMADGNAAVGTDPCDGTNTVFTLEATDPNGEPKATLLMGSIVTDVRADGGRKDLTGGQLAANATVGFNAVLDGPNGGDPIPPSCGAISSDPYSDFCGDGATLIDFFEVSGDGLSLGITSAVQALASFGEGSSIPLDKSGFYKLIENVSGEAIMEVGIDSYMNPNGDLEVWGNFSLVAEGRHYDSSVSTTYEVMSPSFVMIDTDSGQPLEMDVRFIRDGEMKIAWFLPPPRLPIGGEHDINGDTVTDVTLTYDTGMWNFVFSSDLAGVEMYGKSGPMQLTAGTDGSFTASVSETEYHVEFGLNFGDKHFNIYVDMWENGEGNFGWYEVFGGPGGPGGPGDCQDCPQSLFDFGVQSGDSFSLGLGENGFNLDGAGTAMLDISATETSYMIALTSGSSATLSFCCDDAGNVLEQDSFEFPRGQDYPIFIDYHSETGNYAFELFDTGFDIVVRIYSPNDYGPGGYDMHDSDMDGVFDMDDNCIAVANADQQDTDQNGLGDACDLTGIPDMSGVYMVDLMPIDDQQQEYDHEQGICVPMEAGTFLMDVKMQGNQVLMGVRGEEGARLVGVVDANGGFQLLGHDNFVPGPGMFTPGTGFTFDFSDISDSGDGTTTCAGTADVNAVLPTPVVESTELSSTAFHWFEADYWFSPEGTVEAWFDHGLIDDVNVEQQFGWNFEQSIWQDNSAESMDDMMILTDAGVEILDDLFKVTGYGANGEPVMIEPTVDGSAAGIAEHSVDVSGFAVDGVEVRKIVEKAFAVSVPGDLVFSSGAKLFVGTMTASQPIYAFDCDNNDNPWVQNNFNCANIVVIGEEMDPNGVKVPLVAISLDDVVGMGTAADTVKLHLGHGRDNGDFGLIALVSSDDGMATGSGLKVTFMKEFFDGRAAEMVSGGAVSLMSIGNTPVLDLAVPAKLLGTLDHEAMAEVFLFVESGLESNQSVVRMGMVRGGVPEPVMLFNDIAAQDILDNFAPDLSRLIPENGDGCDPTMQNCEPPCDPTVQNCEPPCDPTVQNCEPPCDPTMQNCEPPCDPTTQSCGPMGDPVLGEQLYSSKSCLGCHGADGKGTTPIVPLQMDYMVNGTQVNLVDYIAQTMPQGTPETCDVTCAQDIVAYMESWQCDPSVQSCGGEPPMEMSDLDGDQVMDYEDNCVLVPNADQADTDLNGLGDVCDLTGLPDLSGFYLADLTANANAMEFDEGLGDCVAMVDSTMTLEVHMEGSQVFMTFDGEDQPGLFGLMDQSGVLSLMGDGGFTASAVTHSATDIQFSFTSTDIHTNGTCDGGGSVVANRPAPANAQTVLSAGVNWTDAWSYDSNGDGIDDQSDVEYGHVMATGLETQFLWNPSTRVWEDSSSDALASNKYLTANGVETVDDLIGVVEFADNGNIAVIAPSQNGTLISYAKRNVMFAEFDVTGVTMSSLLGDGYGPLADDAAFASGAMAYVAEIVNVDLSYSFECYDQSGAVFDTLNCDNIVAIEWGANGPVPATTLDDVINIAGDTSANLKGSIHLGDAEDSAGSYEVVGYLVSSDGTQNGTGLMLNIMRLNHDSVQSAPSQLATIDAVIASVGNTSLIEFMIPDSIAHMADVGENEMAPFIFVETVEDSAPYVRMGYRSLPQMKEHSVLFNDEAMSQITAAMSTVF